MGIIQRSLRDKANQRVAAARVLEISCPPAKTSHAVQKLFDTWNEAADSAFEASLATKGRVMRWASSNSSPTTRHFFMLERPNHLMVTFGTSASWVVERGFNRNSRGWVAQMSAAEEVGGATRISVCLAMWSVDDAGRIWNGSRYVQLLDGLVAGLDGKYVSEPVKEEDCYFISQA